MLPILIVDDSGEDLAFAARVLDQCQILNPIRLFKSGDDCIAYFASGSRAEGTLPCLLFLDLIMAPTGGLEVLRHLRSDAKAQGSILVMLSGITDLRIIREGYQLGAATFLVKPLGTVDVLHTLNAIRGLTVRMTADGHVLALASAPNSTGLDSPLRKGILLGSEYPPESQGPQPSS